MATRTAKLRVEVDGEKEYKQAIADLNKGNQVLASEMKKLQAEYKGNESSIEALNAKGDLLQRQLLQQKDKVQTLRDALKRAAQEYGEADKRTQNWQIQLNNAEAAQYDLEHAIEENNQAIENQGRAMDGENQKMISLGGVLDEVAGKLGINIPDGAKKALGSLDNFSIKGKGKLGIIIAAIMAVIEAMKKLHNITVEAAASVDDLVTQSMISGVTTDQLQQWQYAAPFIDVSANTIVGALSKVTKAAAEGNEAFQELGVSVTDQAGHLRDSEDILFDTLEALSQYGNETERNAMANEVFGRSYSDLIPLILQMDEARRLANEALEEGFVLTEDQIRILGEVDDAQEKWNLTVQKNKDQIAAQWGPAVKKAMEMLTDLVDKAGKALIDSKLIENFASLVESTLGLFDAIGALFELLPQGKNPLKEISDAFYALSVVMATVADAATIIAGIMPWNWGSGLLKQGLGMGAEESNLQRILNHNRDTSGQVLNAYNAGGTPNWRGGLTWVGESGPELVSLPRGSAIYSNQESRSMAGDTVINISVNGIQELSEVVDWYQSRRLRGRMA